MKTGDMLKLINSRLSRNYICLNNNIPVNLTIWQKLLHIRYKVNEFWTAKESLSNLSKIFGIYMAKDFYLILKY